MFLFIPTVAMAGDIEVSLDRNGSVSTARFVGLAACEHASSEQEEDDTDFKVRAHAAAREDGAVVVTLDVSRKDLVQEEGERRWSTFSSRPTLVLPPGERGEVTIETGTQLSTLSVVATDFAQGECTTASTTTKRSERRTRRTARD